MSQTQYTRRAGAASMASHTARRRSGCARSKLATAAHLEPCMRRRNNTERFAELPTRPNALTASRLRPADSGWSTDLPQMIVCGAAPTSRSSPQADHVVNYSSGSILKKHLIINNSNPNPGRPAIPTNRVRWGARTLRTQGTRAGLGAREWVRRYPAQGARAGEGARAGCAQAHAQGTVAHVSMCGEARTTYAGVGAQLPAQR